MDTQQNTALTRALAEVPGPLPTSSVIHIAIPHTERFTVVGNHLAQHPDLSCTAVGIQPTALLRPRSPAPAPAPPQAQAQEPAPAPDPMPEQPGPSGPSGPPAPEPPTAPPVPPPPPPLPQAPLSVPLPPQAPPSVPLPLVPPPTAPKPPRRPLPQPSELTPELDRAATAFLSDLPRHAPQFNLSEDDVHRLVPGVAAWLERAAHPDAMRHALTDDPPAPLKLPAKLLTYRLTELLPPPPPGAHDLAALARPRITVTPFQTCDDCDRAFRSPAPGHCRDCREDRMYREHRTEDIRTEDIRTAA